VLGALNALVVVVVLALLTRASIAAWRNRTVAVVVWRQIRPRHVLGSLALIVVVISVAVTLVTFVPVTQLGLGSLIGVRLAPDDVVAFAVKIPTSSSGTDGSVSRSTSTGRPEPAIRSHCSVSREFGVRRRSDVSSPVARAPVISSMSLSLAPASPPPTMAKRLAAQDRSSPAR
jgi:hypothetical protein